MDNKAYNFEVYTCNPTTGETGWDIKFVSVFATTVKEAQENLKKFVPHFDVVILFNRHTHLDEQEAAIYASGRKYFYTDGNYNALPNQGQ